MAKGITTRKAEANLECILSLLTEKPMTLEELTDEANISYKNLLYYVREFTFNNSIHFHAWLEVEREARFVWVKVFAVGSRTGDIPTRPKTLKSVSAKRTYERMKTCPQIFEKSEDDIFKREKTAVFIPTKQAWFSALECV